MELNTVLSVDCARQRIVDSFSALSSVDVPILEGLGHVIAENVYAEADIPPFANSAMDGFALRIADVRKASGTAPVFLSVIGEAAAGSVTSAVVRAGTTIRIMTGAPIPVGADAVIRFEATDEGELPAGRNGATAGIVGIKRPAEHNESIRPAGEDVSAGNLVLNTGTVIRPAEIGMLAALGRTQARVHRRPIIAIMATGDEVVDPGLPLGPGQIRNSNSSTIAALVQRTGGLPIVFGVARDTTDELRAKLQSARDVDLIITTGGVSAGDYDFVKKVLQVEGSIDLWQVCIKPGKPLAFGTINGVPLLGLPGNPVAAAVAFEQFARPAIRRMLGHSNLNIPTVQATLLDRIENHGGRRNFVRVHVTHEHTGYVARLAGPQGSGNLTSLVKGNALLVIPEDRVVAEPGAEFPAQMLDWQHG